MSPVDRSTLPATGPSGILHFPSIERTTLGNGLEVRAIAHRTVPVVCAVLMVRGGTAADPADRPGLAAFMADLLDEGSAGRSALDVADALARFGADFDVDVGSDAIVISLTTLTRFLEPALALVAEMALSPNLAEPTSSACASCGSSGCSSCAITRPALADRAFMRLLYGEHPYGHLGLGTEAALKVVSADEVRRFHRGAFVPASATLVIAGDADPAALTAAAESAFGSWRAQADGAFVNHEAGRQPPPAAPDRRPHVRLAGGIGAVRTAHRPRVRVAQHARLPCTPAAEHDPRRTIREPRQHEPPPGQGVHLRRAYGFDLRRGIAPSRCRRASTPR
jgi:predicted Zn-dependent peptidase